MSDIYVRPASNHDVACIILLANEQEARDASESESIRA